ncbi:hypothetical protein ACIGW3_25705 [Streptomyces sp. NPDC053499]|uniref:hypothetical protein n=1 Tax=Streptomyces sp. NPDC053499 TaxID=3365707 RepID=UPI0037CD6DB2
MAGQGSGSRGAGLLRGTRRRLGAGALAGLVLVGVALAVPDGEQRPKRCSGAEVTGWRTDERMTRELARYGDDNARFDDWTGGDGTRSVRLPDGRTLWLSADTFLDQVFDQAPGVRGRKPNPVWVRNAALVMSRDGRFERTLLGGTGMRPAALFPGTATADGREVWRWPVQAVVEPRRPGSSEKVVRVLLWQREAGRPPWIFGVPRASQVATLSLPGLRLEGIEPIHRPRHGEIERRVLYGTSAVTQGDWTYIFGADEGSVDGKASRAHLARAPRGRLDDADAWQFWAGSGDGGSSESAEGDGNGGGAGGGWQDDPERSEPILVGKTVQRGATGTYSVVRHGDSWLLLTMDAGAPDGGGVTDIVSYWACAPTGPWHGPGRVAKPPLPEGAAGVGAVPYNPQGHPEFGAGRGAGAGTGKGLLVSYDVNVLDAGGAIQRNVAYYRPRFLRLTLGPAR